MDNGMIYMYMQEKAEIIMWICSNHSNVYENGYSIGNSDVVFVYILKYNMIPIQYLMLEWWAEHCFYFLDRMNIIRFRYIDIQCIYNKYEDGI